MSNNAYYEDTYNGYSPYKHYNEQYSPKTALTNIKCEINTHEKHAEAITQIETDSRYLSYEDEFPLSSSTGKSGSPTGKSKQGRLASHTPRPSNSFILYRREKHLEIMQQYKGVKTLNNNVISKIVANMWRQETAEVKAHFAAMADAEKRAHMLKYPDYKYKPRKATSKKASIVRKPSLSQREVKLVPIADQYGNGSMATYPMMNQHQLPYMMPNIAMGYHIDQQIPRMAMVESDRECYNRFEISPSYEQEFVHPDSLVTPADYTHSWPMQPVNQVWDLGLSKPFESANE
jgi:hypothetical protein